MFGDITEFVVATVATVLVIIISDFNTDLQYYIYNKLHPDWLRTSVPVHISN